MEKVMESLADRLQANPVHRRFVEHEFFASVRAGGELDREQVGTLLGQWWYPLHYFTTFLARCVATLPDVASKSAITTILNQEAGGGKAEHAHEVIYVDSMAKAGFDPSVVTGSAPFPRPRPSWPGTRRRPWTAGRRSGSSSPPRSPTC